MVVLTTSLVTLVAPLATPLPPGPADTLLGEGRHVYEWVEGWPALAEGEAIGSTHGCILPLPDGRVAFNTETERAVVIVGDDGTVERTLAPNLAGGLHGMALVHEGDELRLWLVHTNFGAVGTIDLEGRPQKTIGFPQESGLYEKPEYYKPTSVAIGPAGDVFVADGYGRSYVHHFDADGKWLKAFGGPGQEPGQMRTPHGLWLDTRVDPPNLLVADRENNRLQVFDLDGKFLRVIDAGLRRPCHVHERDGELAIAELTGRVTILDKDDNVVTRLGDSGDNARQARPDLPSEAWRVGEFIAPHCAGWDAEGNLFVLGWSVEGRVVKLRRLKPERAKMEAGE